MRVHQQNPAEGFELALQDCVLKGDEWLNSHIAQGFIQQSKHFGVTGQVHVLYSCTVTGSECKFHFRCMLACRLDCGHKICVICNFSSMVHEV